MKLWITEEDDGMSIRTTIIMAETQQAAMEWYNARYPHRQLEDFKDVGGVAYDFYADRWPDA